MMFSIAIQTLLGHQCPLTLLEASLRHERIEGLFFARMIHAFLFWDLPLSVFATLYLVCLIWAITLWFHVPPFDGYRTLAIKANRLATKAWR
jgi:hypothetical protein